MAQNKKEEDAEGCVKRTRNRLILAGGILVMYYLFYIY